MYTDKFKVVNGVMQNGGYWLPDTRVEATAFIEAEKVKIEKKESNLSASQRRFVMALERK